MSVIVSSTQISRSWLNPAGTRWPAPTFSRTTGTSSVSSAPPRRRREARRAREEEDRGARGCRAGGRTDRGSCRRRRRPGDRAPSGRRRSRRRERDAGRARRGGGDTRERQVPRSARLEVRPRAASAPPFAARRAHAGEEAHVAVLAAGRREAAARLHVGPFTPLAVGVAEALEVLAALDHAGDVGAEEAHVVARAARLARPRVRTRRPRRRAVRRPVGREEGGGVERVPAVADPGHAASVLGAEGEDLDPVTEDVQVAFPSYAAGAAARACALHRADRLVAHRARDAVERRPRARRSRERRARVVAPVGAPGGHARAERLRRARGSGRTTPRRPSR